MLQAASADRGKFEARKAFKDDVVESFVRIIERRRSWRAGDRLL